MHSKRAIAHFRQLCCLGLPKESLGQALLEALHHVVPSLHNRIAWCDDRGKPTAIYCEAPEMYLYGKHFLEHYDNRLPDFPGSAFIFSRPRGVGHYLPYVTGANYFGGKYHNEIEAPVGGHYFLDLVIADEQSTLATIFLQRDTHARPYSETEIETLDRLIPYIVHAMRANPAPATDSFGRNETALLVTDESGCLIHATAKARQWLGIAFFPDARQTSILSKLTGELPDTLKALCRSLARVQAGHPARPPSVVVRNAWGRFRFSAQPLNDKGASAGLLIGIVIEHSEPRTVTMMRNMWTRGLSSAQKKVCLAFMQTRETEAEVARRLSVSTSTVRDHLAKIYDKLDIHSREALIESLTANGTDAP